MRKLFAIALTLATLATQAQKNVFLEQSFWKENPSVDAVKAAIAQGNDPLAFNPSSFDGTTLAINNGAPNETVKYMLTIPGITVKRLTHDSRIYLHWAASKGNVELVEYLLANGSSLDQEDSHGYVPIAFAANGGQSNPALYEAFFKAGVDPKKKYKGVNLLLMGIANDKDLALTSYFESKGLSLKDTDDNGNTAFNYAARAGNLDLLKKLLDKGVKYTDNALIMAAQGTRRGANPIEVYKYLVEDLKIKPTVQGPTGENVLHILVRKPNQREIINYFLAKGLDINQADKEGNTAFINAASGADLQLVTSLLPKVSNINAVNQKGETALFGAVRTSSPEVVALLLNNRADAKLVDKSGYNLAYHLVQSYRGQRPGSQTDEFADKVKLLQDKGLNFASAQKDGSTLYHLAVAKNDINLLKKITDLKVDVNAKNKDGFTALHRAAMVSKDDAVLKYLLSVGAKKDIKTEFDETAYDLASENEFLAKNKVAISFLQ